MLQGLRRSAQKTPNPNLVKVEEEHGDAPASNGQWVANSGITDGLLLLGGTSVAHFRLRVAQSELRQDLLPSFWSTAGILLEGRNVLTVDLDAISDTSVHVERNAVEVIPLARFDDASRFPNIALIEFCPDHRQVIERVIEIGKERNIVDLLGQISEWLPYLWGIPSWSNPLLKGVGIPAATLVERAHALAGIDLSPGLASAASCPEAIWQAARWWSEILGEQHGEKAKEASYPRGSYTIRQLSAAVVGIRDAVVDNKVVQSAKLDPFFVGLQSLRKGKATKKPARGK